MLFAAGVWAGVAGFEATLFGVIAGLLAVALRRSSGGLLLVGVLAGVVVSGLTANRLATSSAAWVPNGLVDLHGVVVDDPRPGPLADGVIVVRPRLLVVDGRPQSWPGPDLVVRGDAAGVLTGEPVEVIGILNPDLASYRGRPVGGSISARTIDRLGAAPNPVLALGNALRRRVLGSLDSAARRPPGALLAGFLIGDVSRLPRADSEALRAAGLSHFVAVSGSNVALFLAAWWLAGGPLGMGPRRRAVFGMVGVAVFVVVTRWEPSVVRAALMAWLVLTGRLAGRPISPWTALGGASSITLLVAPGLARSYGFALSVFATAGIIGGAGIWKERRPRMVWTVLGATVSAQAAVAPLLLLWFGAVPLLAPLSNLLAAPLVSVSTALGGIGALTHSRLLIVGGVGVAQIVLGVAHAAAGLPQVTLPWVLPSLTAVVATIRFRWLRPVGMVAVAVAVVAAIVPSGRPANPTVSFLDIGQGDATVFRGPSGETILVDGGPDPLLLQKRLGDLGVDRIDLLVVSHRHADHVLGLSGIFANLPVGLVWHAPELGQGPVLDGFVAEARAAGVSARSPDPGDQVRIGVFTVVVRGPLRRYAGPNDASLVIDVAAGGVDVMMTGDIEAVAQRDLGPLSATIMKVPHQGSATSDLDWLRASAPQIAVISVGENDFGHPAAAVVEELRMAGSVVVRTDEAGTVTIAMGGTGGVVGSRLPSAP